MRYTFNAARLAAILKAKRAKQGLRETAKGIGNVSASTLSRIETGEWNIDVEMFLALCNWLDMPPVAFFVGDTPRRMTRREEISALIYEEKAFSNDEKAALISILGLAYDRKGDSW